MGYGRRHGDRLYSDKDEPCFKTRLEALLYEHNLNNRVFAQTFQIAESTVSGYLKGDRTPGLACFIEICDFFSVSADWLLGRSDIKEVLDGKEDA